MKARKLMKACLGGKSNYISLVIFLLVYSITIISFILTDTQYAHSEITNLISEYGSVEKIPGNLYAQATEKNIFYIDIFFYVISIVFSLVFFSMMFGIAVQNNLSRKTFIKAFTMSCVVESVVFSVLSIVGSMIANKFAEYTLITTFLGGKISDLVGASEPLSILISFVCLIAEVLLSNLMGALMVIAGTKFGTLRMLLGMLFVISVIVATLVYVFDKSMCIFAALSVLYIVLMIISFLKMSKSISLESKIFEEV